MEHIALNKNVFATCCMLDALCYVLYAILIYLPIPL